VQPITPHSREWKAGVVIRPVSSRTYEVKMNDGSTLRRNRQFLRTAPASRHLSNTVRDGLDSTPLIPTSSSEPAMQQDRPPPASDEIRIPQPPVPTSDNTSQPDDASQQTIRAENFIRTRSGRVSKPAERLNL